MQKEGKKWIIQFRCNFTRTISSIIANNIVISAYPRNLRDLKIRFEGEEELYDPDEASHKLKHIVLYKGQKLSFYLVNSKNKKEKKCNFDLFKCCPKIMDMGKTYRIRACCSVITNTLKELGFEF